MPDPDLMLSLGKQHYIFGLRLSVVPFANELGTGDNRIGRRLCGHFSVIEWCERAGRCHFRNNFDEPILWSDKV